METVVGDHGCKISTLVEIFMESPSYSIIQQNLHALSVALDLPSFEIQILKRDILLDKITSSEALAKTLECWVKLFSRRATLGVLIHALRSRHWVCMADTIMSSDKLNVVWPISITTKWNELNQCTKDFVFSIPVVLNGKEIAFKEFLEYGDVVSDLEMNYYLNGQLLHGIVNSSNLLVDEFVPTKPSYYHPRMIIASKRIDERVFTVECQLVFAVYGIDWFDLTKIVKGKQTDRSSSQLQSKKLTVRFILLEHLEDFSKLCKLSQNDVHLIQYFEGSFQLVLSCPCKRNTDFLSFYFHTEQNYVTEDDFLSSQLADKHVKSTLVTDIAGSGKTQLLASLARKLQVLSFRNLVLYVKMHSLAQQLQRFGSELSYGNILQEISNQISGNELGRYVLCKIMSKSGTFNVHLFFDAIDELCETTNTILKVLCESKDNLRLYVSARPHISRELERLLGVNSISLKPFSREEQIEYFTKFWEISAGIYINESVINFSETILSHIDKNISISISENVIGQPIQCHMLAKVYLEEVKKMGYTNMLGYIFPIKTVFEMYRNYINDQFSRVVSNVNNMNFIRVQYISFAIELHSDVCWHWILPSIHDYLTNSTDSIRRNEILQVGILKLSRQSLERESIQFIHQTYSDYLLAEFISNLIKNSEVIKLDSDTLQQKFTLLVLMNILSSTEDCDQILRRSPTDFETMKYYRFRNPVFCFFLNSHLDLSGDDELDVFNAFSRMRLTPNLIKRFYQIFSSCIAGNYYSIFLVAKKVFLSLLESSPILHLGQYSPWKNLLLIAAKYSNFPSLSTYCKFVVSLEHFYGCKLNFLLPDLNPLNVSAQRGDYAVFSYFLFENNTNIAYSEEDFGLMLRYGLLDSLNDTPGQISQKILIMKLLVDKFDFSDMRNNINNVYKNGIHACLLDWLLDTLLISI